MKIQKIHNSIKMVWRPVCFSEDIDTLHDLLKGEKNGSTDKVERRVCGSLWEDAWVDIKVFIIHGLLGCHRTPGLMTHHCFRMVALICTYY